MKKIIIAGMALVLTGIALVSTGCDNNDLKQPKTYIIPNVVECVGHVVQSEIGYARNLICEDGRVFHNIVNFQEVIQLNPLCQEGK